MFFDRSKLSLLFSHSVRREEDKLFSDIYGCDDTKKLFATSNNVEKIITPLQSRFFIVKLQDYTYKQFYGITVRLLTSNHYNVDEEIAKATADAVWKTSRNIRESIRIAKIAKTVEDVDLLANTFFDPLSI